jgi:hypothetical protein
MKGKKERTNVKQSAAHETRNQEQMLHAGKDEKGERVPEASMENSSRTFASLSTNVNQPTANHSSKF